jgi:alcohol dehydrogenase
MRAAVWHEGVPELVLEEMPDPEMIPESVIIKVEAAFVPGGLAKKIRDPGEAALPPRPFVPGIDTVGRVIAVADGVSHVAPGDLVYCDHFYGSRTQGGVDDRCILTSFPLGPDSPRHLETWRHGNLAEKMITPAECMIPLGAVEGKASAAQFARLGWYGTAYGGFINTALQPGETAIVSGASGQVGAVGVLMALALGARRVVATGRRKALLEEVAALAPDRVVPVVLGGDDDAAAIRDAAGGGGADVMLDAIGYGAGPEATMAALGGLGQGGRAALVGAGFTAPLSLVYEDLLYRELTIMGSIWFPRWAAHRMVAMIASGQLEIAPVEAITFPLDQVHEALAKSAESGLGLRHVVVSPG